MPEAFETGLVITASASVVHPEGTVLDENGHPILPQEQE
jgi:hypothetical protein